MSWADMVRAPLSYRSFKWRQFEPEVILLAVGWYLRFSLSYRWSSPSDYCNQLRSCNSSARGLKLVR